MFGFIFKKIFGSKNDRYLRRLRPIVARINALEPQMQELADEDFAQRMAEYRQQVQAGERTLDDLLPEVFALVREAAESWACATMTCSWWAASCCTAARSPK